MEHANVTVDLEADLAELLDDLSTVQEEMLVVLGEKRQRMASRDLDAMTSLEPRERELCNRLEACHRRRLDLLEAAAGQGMPSDSMGKLANALPDKPDKLGKQVKEVSQRMRLLQHHSLTNWVLAQRSLLHLSQLLEIVATGGRLQPTYTRGDSSPSGGALVDREA